LTGSNPGTESGQRWSFVVLFLGAAVTALVLVGIWSASLALDSSVAETKRDLTADYTMLASGQCDQLRWIDPGDLIDHKLPQYFARGPGRQTSIFDRIFKPRVVYRVVVPLPENASSEDPWGYVVSESPLPFFVRTTYGVFRGGNDTYDDGVPVGSVEGVRTYFSLFGKKVYLNEWGVRSQTASPPPMTEDSP
jgi:hypothetical protein